MKNDIVEENVEEFWPTYKEDADFYKTKVAEIGRGNIVDIRSGNPHKYSDYGNLFYIAIRGDLNPLNNDYHGITTRRLFLQIYSDNTFEWLGDFESYSGVKKDFERITKRMFNDYDIILNPADLETELMEDIQNNISSEEINDFIEDLYDLRKESIAKDGEYGLGNLVFKEMRNLGYLDNLKELKNKIKSKELSLEHLEEK